MRLRFASGVLIAITAAGALALAGCGGSGGGSSSTTSSATTQTSATAKQSATRPKSKQKSNGKSPSAKATTPGGSTAKGKAGKKAGAAQENAMIVRTYGTAGSSSERDQAAQAAALFLSARAAGNWTQACSNLAAKLRSQLEPYAQTTTGSAEQRCTEALRRVAAKTPKTTPAGAEVHALTLRVKGDEALLIYRDGAGKTLDIPMRREGGHWLVGSIAPGPLAR